MDTFLCKRLKTPEEKRDEKGQREREIERERNFTVARERSSKASSDIFDVHVWNNV